MVLSTRLATNLLTSNELWDLFFFNKPVEYTKPPSNLYEVYEEKEFKGLRLQVALAGFSKKDVQIVAKGTTLKISGKNIKESVNPKFQCEFSWEYSIRKDLDLEKVEGSLENGLLSLFIPAKKSEK
ncbi:MAG TPA: Hsp20 family protein, partial [Candidatus Lokiarchaeia archaeon]